MPLSRSRDSAREQRGALASERFSVRQTSPLRSSGWGAPGPRPRLQTPKEESKDSPWEQRLEGASGVAKRTLLLTQQQNSTADGNVFLSPPLFCPDAPELTLRCWQTSGHWEYLFLKIGLENVYGMWVKGKPIRQNNGMPK